MKTKTKKSESKKTRNAPLNSKASHAVVTWIQSWVKASRAPWAEWTWNQSQQLAHRLSKSWQNAATWHSWSPAPSRPVARKRASSARVSR